MSQKRLVNVFLVALLSLIVIDAAPRTSRAHQWLKDAIDPVLDVTGLWQETWTLFAPEPDRVNVRITARITFADGSLVDWSSPDWSQMSVLERFLNFREMEFVDSIRLDTSADAWPAFADYLARTVPHPRQPRPEPVRVVLTRHWLTVPSPEEAWEPFGAPPRYPESFPFHTRDYP